MSLRIQILIVVTLAFSAFGCKRHQTSAQPVAPSVPRIVEDMPEFLAEYDWKSNITWEPLTIERIGGFISSPIPAREGGDLWHQAFDLGFADGWSFVLVPNTGIRGMGYNDGTQVYLENDTWVLADGVSPLNPNVEPIEYPSDATGIVEDLYRRRRAEMVDQYTRAAAGDEELSYLAPFAEQCSDNMDACAGPSLESFKREHNQVSLATLSQEAQVVFPMFSFAQMTEMFAAQGYDMGDTTVRLMLIQSPPYNLPLEIGFGGWNECPAPAVHAALWRVWYDAYGIQPAYIGPDTVEFWVARPPTDPATVANIAWQQFLYDQDIVFQGTGTIQALAQDLAGSNHWYFWWD